MRSTASLPTNLTHKLTTHSAPINTLTFSHSGGSYILTGSSDRQIHLSRTEPSTKSISQARSNNITSRPVQASSDTVYTKEPIQRYTSHGYAVLDISVTTDNTKFVSSSNDRSGPFLWDINTGDSTLRRFGGNSPTPHTSRITCVSFTAADSIVVSASDDRSVRLWDMKSRDGRPLMILEDAKDGITSLECHDTEIIAGSTDGRVRSYDVRTGRCTVDVQPGPVTSLCLSRDTRTLLVGCLDSKLRLMDRENGGCLRTFPGELDAISATVVDSGNYTNTSLRLQSCFAAEEKLLISGSENDGRVRAWDVLTGKMVASVEVGNNNKVVSVVRWRDGSEILGQERKGLWASGGADGIVRVYA